MTTKIADLLPDQAPRRVIPAMPPIRCSPSGHFVRDSRGIAVGIAHMLADIRLTNSGIASTPRQIDSWIRPIEKLFRLANGPAPPLRVLRVVRWYLEAPSWRKDEYIPRVDSGQALLEKFSRLEDAMLKRVKPDRPEETPAEVLTRVLGDRTARTLEADVLPAARQLRLTTDQTALAAALADLYAAVRDARVSANLPRDVRRQLGGPADLIRRYLGWVHDRDWTATLKVLNFESPSFTQFRRECARDEVVRRDPVTGRS